MPGVFVGHGLMTWESSSCSGPERPLKITEYSDREIDASKKAPTREEHFMKEWLTFITENAVVVINAIALMIVIIGSIGAFFQSTRAIFSPQAAAGPRLREGYLHYGRWLVAGLTFQLAADIIATSIAPTWEEIGRLGAVAVIRTFLNFFLERDLAEAQRELQSKGSVDTSM